MRSRGAGSTRTSRRRSRSRCPSSTAARTPAGPGGSSSATRHVHPFVRDALDAPGGRSRSGLGDEGYVLATSAGDTSEIVIAAHAAQRRVLRRRDAAAARRRRASAPGRVHRRLPRTRRSAAPTSRPTRSMGFANGRNVFSDRQRAFIDWLAARKFNTLFLVDNGDFFQPEDTWVDAYEELFAYARERFVEPVPRICSISTVGPFPFAYYEGWFVAGRTVHLRRHGPGGGRSPVRRPGCPTATSRPTPTATACRTAGR